MKMRGIKFRPTTNGREVLPLPVGHVLYDSLHTAFVDLAGIISGLQQDSFSGYLRVLTEAESGTLLFADGKIQMAIWDNGVRCLYDNSAAEAIGQAIGRGQGSVDIATLPSGLISALVSANKGTAVYSDLYSEWVNMPALIKHLERKHFSGVVKVSLGDITGFVVLSVGQISYAYISGMLEADDDAQSVLELAEDQGSVIEVRAGNSEFEPNLDIALALSAMEQSRKDRLNHVPLEVSVPQTVTSEIPHQAPAEGDQGEGWQHPTNPWSSPKKPWEA